MSRVNIKINDIDKTNDKMLYGSIISSENERFIHEHEITNKGRPSILTMQNEWTTYSSIEVQRKILKYNTKIIQDYINSLLVPSWYRGVSKFQKESADRLLNAVRDDCAQRTTYRTIRCLESIGLDPLPTKKQLRTILQLCGGSDLTFLWFLMELLYRDNESDSYSVNEQLIMTSIAHLDMNTTLKELERILPPAQNKKSNEMSRRKRRLMSKTSSNNIRKYSEWKELPYFEKLPQPQAKNPNCIDIQDQQNIILNCSQNHIFNFSNRKTNLNYPTFQKYNSQNSSTKGDMTSLNDFLANSLDENKVQTIYRQLEDIEVLRISFNEQLNDIAKNKIQDMELTFEKNEQSFKQVLNRFENDVEKQRHEFNKLAKNYLLRSSSNLLSYKSQIISDNMSLYSKQCKRNIASISNTKICTNSLVLEENNSKYFIAAQNQQPYKFDYSKIFPYGDNNSEFSVLNELRSQSQLDSYNCGDSENILSSCIDNIWQQEVIKHQKLQFINNIEDTKLCNVVDYGLKYYDPDNDELMDKMLEDALDIIKRNHKFVLASMPAVHRFPLLREWIRLRYGKIFKKNYLAKTFKESQPIFKALAKVGLPVELPSNADMGKDLIIDYSCYDYVIRKSKHIRKEYYSRIDKAILAQSRVIYFAMRPLLSCNDPLCNTIFAYMPAHKRENYHFRPWKLEECMKYKQVNYLQHKGQSSKKLNIYGNRLTKKQKTKNSK